MATALFILDDPSIFIEDSVSRARMRAYAKEIGTLHVLSHGVASDSHEDFGDGTSLSLYSVDSRKLSGMKPFLFHTLLKRAQTLVSEKNVEIVSVQNPFEYGLVAMKAIQGTKVKLYVQVYTDPFSTWFTRVKVIYSSEVKMPAVNRVRQSITDRVLPNAHGVRVVSKRAQDSLIARYGSRIPTPKLIPVEVSTELPPMIPLPERPFTFTLLAVGRLEPEKRIQDILLALAKIRRNYPSVGLIVVGEGSQRKNLEGYAKKLRLGKSVQFLGHVDGAWGMMRSAQAYIQASGYEGYSRTLLEAALARVPIITTDVGIVGEVFRGYEDVLSVPPGDPAAIANFIIRLVEDNEARTQLVINAEKTAREHLANVHASPADIARELRSMIEKTP